jgi:ankyrin repeat protein
MMPRFFFRFAAQYGHLDITRYLLDKGANPNLRAKDQLDPLLSAIDFGHKEIIQTLISHGANVHTKV